MDLVRDGRGATRHGIPTLYAGVRFRSRLEATWARFFDLVGWPWTYEPFDLQGYIPDFVLPMQAGPLLVEVKPETSIAGLLGHTEKLDSSGWHHEALIVGAGPVAAREYATEPVSLGIGKWMGDPAHAWTVDWDEMQPMTCLRCGRASLRADLGAYSCRVNGCTRHHIGPDFGALRLWRSAQNDMQWTGRGKA